MKSTVIDGVTYYSPRHVKHTDWIRWVELALRTVTFFAVVYAGWCAGDILTQHIFTI